MASVLDYYGYEDRVHRQRQVVLEEMQSLLPGSPDKTINLDLNFASQGGTSFLALLLLAACRRRGILIELSKILSNTSIAQVISSAKEDTTSGLSRLTSEESSDHEPKPSRSTSMSESPDERASPPVSARMPPNAAQGFAQERMKFVPGDKKHDTTRFRQISYEKHALYIRHETGELRMSDLTQGQLALISGSHRRPGANIINHVQKLPPNFQLVDVKRAWLEIVCDGVSFASAYRDASRAEQPLLPVVHWHEYVVDDRSLLESFLLQPERTLQDLHGPGYHELDIHLTAVSCAEQDRGDCRFNAIIWTVHHALIDAWSAHQIRNRLLGVLCGAPSRPPIRPFSDVALDILQLEAESRTKAGAFWEAQKAGFEVGKKHLALPRPNVQTHAEHDIVDELSWPIDPSEHAGFQNVARKYGVTLGTLITAAWVITMSRYGDADSIVFGVPVSTRGLPIKGAFETVGPMVNTLPFIMTISWDQPLPMLLLDVANRMQQLIEFSWSRPCDFGITAGIDCLLVIRDNFDSVNGPVDSTAVVAGAPLGAGLSWTRQTTSVPLCVLVTPGEDITLQYLRNDYRKEDMARLLWHLVDIMDGIVTAPNASIQTLISAAQSTEAICTLREAGNCNSGTTLVGQSSEDLVSLFETVVSKFPDWPALYQEDQTMTYRELYTHASQAATRLVSVIQRGEVITVSADGSMNWIIAIYAVLLAGGVYCPMALTLPQSVRDDIFEDSNARFHLDCSAESGRTGQNVPSGAVVLHIEEMTRCFEQDQNCLPCWADRPRDAYVCFTSGSTGRPKGVVCTHEGLVAFQRDLRVRLMAQPGRRIAQMMSPAFDGSIHEIFSALSYGAVLVLRRSNQPTAHLQDVDSVILTPSVAALLNPSDFPRLQTIYLVGEPVPQQVSDAWSNSKEVYNMYGPTEGTCGATIAELKPGRPVTLGRPNPSTRIYILDQCKRLSPIGCIGEIYLAGVQVARGYIGQTPLTIDRFMADSICPALGERMYRTGDRGYWTSDGLLMYCGRNDRQKKLKGYRVDLDDIEQRLRVGLGSKVQSLCVVLTPHDELACVCQTWESLSTIQDLLQRLLPPFAIPQHVLIVDEMPLSTSGKLDYQALLRRIAGQVSHDQATSTQDSPHRPTEVQLLRLVSTAIARGDMSNQKKCFSSNSRFSHLDSIAQLQLLWHINATFSTRLSLRQLLDCTPSQLAEQIDSLTTKPDKLPRSLSRLEPTELSPAELYCWRRHVAAPESSFLHVGVMWYYKEEGIERGRATEAWNAVMSQFEIFRSQYNTVDGRTHRRLSEHIPRVESADHFEPQSLIDKPFDLDRGLPVRLMADDEKFAVVWHHIVCDYTTLGLVLGQVACELGLPPSGTCGSGILTSLHDYCNASAWTQTPSAEDLQYWSTTLGCVPLLQPQALVHRVERRRDFSGSAFTIKIEEGIARRFGELTCATNMGGQTILLAACFKAFTTADTPNDVVVGVPFVNRRTPSDFRIGGLFLEPLPIRIKTTKGNLTPDEYLTIVYESMSEALTHAIPWEALMKHLGHDVSNLGFDHPLFDCVVSFHDWRAGDHWSKSTVNPARLYPSDAKFKLMIEMTMHSCTSGELRVEYDSKCYGGGVGNDIVDSVLRALDELLAPRYKETDITQRST